jgi:hypothetical protein
MRQDAGSINAPATDAGDSKAKESSSQSARSCAERSCATGLGCLTLIIVVSAFLLRMFLGSTEEVAGVPAHVPSNFPILDRDSMHGSTVTTVQRKSRLVDASLWWPRLLLSLNANGYSTGATRITALQTTFRDVLHASRDTVTLTWQHIPAQPATWIQSYREALTGAGYTVLTTTETTIAFSSDRVTGLLTLENSEYTTDIDAATVVLHIAQP